MDPLTARRAAGRPGVRAAPPDDGHVGSCPRVRFHAQVRAAARRLVLVSWSALAVAGCEPLDVKPFVASLTPPVHIAHRGGSGIYPENTMDAFERAVDVDGTDLLELDVHTSADGVLVVHHDDDVDRTTDGHGAIHDLTLEEIAALDAAYWFDPEGSGEYPLRGQGVTIPTLQEVLERFPDTPLSIEAKQIEPSLVDELASAVEEAGRVDSVLLASFDDATVEAIRERLPDVAVNYGENATRCVVFQHTLQAGWGACPNADVLTVPPESSGITVITPRLLDSAHARGVPVYAWTIDDPDEMNALLDLGVDGIMTDRPDVLRDVLDGR